MNISIMRPGALPVACGYQRRIILLIGGIMFFYFSRQTGKLLRRFGSR